MKSIEKQFCMYDDIPIFETEDGGVWVGYGLWEKKEFLNRVIDIAYYLSGENLVEDLEERDLLLPHVTHMKARVGDEPDLHLWWRQEDQKDPNAIDITVLKL